MAAKKVLLIGLEPSVVDFSELPAKLDEPTLRAALDVDLKRVRELGYDAKWLLTDRGETAARVVAEDLAATSYDVILVGAGIRTIPSIFSLFEKLLNVIHEKAPHAKIAFNTKPDDTAASVQRWA